MDKTIQERFERKFAVTPGCWNWTAAKNEDGYGYVAVQRMVKKAHRVAYELYVGAIPAGLCVMHKCDNPGCVNPDHLSVGTQKENVLDMHSKGRAANASGEFNGRAKITSEKAALIRLDSRPANEIAAQHGITAHHVRAIKRGKLWLN